MFEGAFSAGTTAEVVREQSSRRQFVGHVPLGTEAWEYLRALTGVKLGDSQRGWIRPEERQRRQLPTNLPAVPLFISAWREQMKSSYSDRSPVVNRICLRTEESGALPSTEPN